MTWGKPGTRTKNPFADKKPDVGSGEQQKKKLTRENKIMTWGKPGTRKIRTGEKHPDLEKNLDKWKNSLVYC